MVKKRKFEDGTICHINFGNVALNGEIYNYHLGVIFNIKGINNTIFCIPLTSPKPKHFETLLDYNNRNYRNMKYYRYHYIKQTDSVALLEQIKTISIDRLNDYYRDNQNNVIILNDIEKELIVAKTKKYIDLILNKKIKNKDKTNLSTKAVDRQKITLG